MITAENILLVGSILIFTSILISKTGYRFGIPTLLLFLLVGMAFGSDGLGIQFNSASDAQFIGMMALSIILFSGGMDTRYADIKPVLKQGILLSTVGVLVTTLLTGLFIFFLSHYTHANIELTLMVSLLLAATMSSTDSASVFSLLRSQRMNLKYNLRPMLELESGSNDPMAYMMTILLISVVSNTSSGVGLGMSVVFFVVQMVVGALSGYLIGRLAVWTINKINLANHSLYSVLLLAFIFFSFAFTDLIKGKTVDEALAVTNKQVVDALGGLPAYKLHCSVLAEESIKAAVKNYYDRNNIPYDHSKFPDCEHCEGGCPMV